MGANAFPRIGNISHDGLFLFAAHAENRFQAFEEHLQNVIAFPRRVFNKLIQGANNNAANNEPFNSAHDYRAKTLQA